MSASFGLRTALLLLLGGSVVWAATEDQLWHRVQRGELLYRIHCATCHGGDGRGDGPMGEVLTHRPTDLTRLDEGGDGWLVHARDVLVGVSGRWLGVHGRREMPVWGASFVDRGRVGEQGSEVESEIDSLMAFLGSIQVSQASQVSPSPPP